MTSLVSLLEKMPEKTILVIGDPILDISVYSEAIGLSLETPTLKTKKIVSSTTMGGAANVVKNCLALGAKCHFVTVLGDDEMCSNYENWMHDKLAISTAIEKRENVSKTRHWVRKSE